MSEIKWSAQVNVNLLSPLYCENNHEIPLVVKASFLVKKEHMAENYK